MSSPPRSRDQCGVVLPHLSMATQVHREDSYATADLSGFLLGGGRRHRETNQSAFNVPKPLGCEYLASYAHAVPIIWDRLVRLIAAADSER